MQSEMPPTMQNSVTRLETIRQKFPEHFQTKHSVIAANNNNESVKNEEIPEFEELEYDILDFLESCGLDTSFNRLEALDNPHEKANKPKWQREREKAAKFLNMKK